MLIHIPIDDLEERFREPWKVGLIKYPSIDYATNAIHGWFEGKDEIICKLLAWMDAAAAGFAAEVCDTPRMVTKLIDECVFNKPAREGQLLKIYGIVERVGNTSVTLKLEARSHNVYNGKQNVILSTNMVFVRIDEQGDAIPISDRVRLKYNKK